MLELDREYDPNADLTPVGYGIQKVLTKFKDEHPDFAKLSFPDFVKLCDLGADAYNKGKRNKFGILTHDSCGIIIIIQNERFAGWARIIFLRTLKTDFQ